MSVAMTQEQWFDRLKSWLPSWFFADPNYQEADLQALARILSAQDRDSRSLILQTYIDDAEGPFLDLLGDERGIKRFKSEQDSAYRKRIKNIFNVSDVISIRDLVNAFLINGQASVVIDSEADVFFDREVFFNRGVLFIEKIMNAFSVVVDNQTHSPYSFFGREHFMNREDFFGTTESPIEMFESIIQAVNESKAFGTVYRLVERSGA